MAKQLYLYSGYTPNLGQGEHLLVNNMAGLVSAMTTYRQQTVALDNYRINGGIAQVKPASNAMSNYLTMSYAIEYDTSGQYGRAYFIKSAQPRADWIDYELELDHWGTFMHQASIQDLVIRRTNRNIGTGIYDKVEVSNLQDVQYYTDTPAISETSLSVIFLTDENVKVNNFSALTEQTVTRQKLYLVPISTPYSSPIQNILSAVSNVQNIYEREIATDWNPKLRVIKAWLIPRTFTMTYSWMSNVTLKYINPATGAETTLSATEIGPYRRTVSYSVETDPDYQYYAGTTTNGIELNNLTTAQNVEYEFMTNADGIQVMVRSGNNIKDITQAFEIGLTINEGQVTGLQKLTNAISTMGSIAAIGATVAGVAAPGIGLLAGASMIGSAAQQVQRLSSQTPTRHTGYGDGIITYMTENAVPLTIYTPFRLIRYRSVQNENAHARLKGAVFNIPYTSLHALESASYLGTGSVSDNTYVEADCDVMNIQSDAAQVIKEKLHNGIYIKDLL